MSNNKAPFNPIILSPVVHKCKNTGNKNSRVVFLYCVTYSRLLICHKDGIAGQVVAGAGRVRVVGL